MVDANHGYISQLERVNKEQQTKIDKLESLLDDLWAMKDIGDMKNAIRAFSKPKAELKE